MTSIDNPNWLAGAMDSEAERPAQWEPSELAMMLTHQLAAPIRADLAKLAPDLVQQFDDAVPAVPGAKPLSFGELFFGPQPPVVVLQIVKDFAKRAIADKEGPLPEEIGATLYYASISAAMLRHGQRISGLDDATLRIGLDWALGQSWMDKSLISLFRELLPKLR